MISFEQAKKIALEGFMAESFDLTGGKTVVSNKGEENADYFMLNIGDERWIVDNDSAYRSDDDAIYLVNKNTGKYSEVSYWWIQNQGLVFTDVDITKSAPGDLNKNVPGPLEVARGLSRLEILPNPTDLTIENPERYVESPWQTVPVPTIDPLLWDDAQATIVTIADLLGTDPFLNRKKVGKHIENMGQSLTPHRSLALILDLDGELIIIDGHHRLMALWLLGQDSAPAYMVRKK